MELGLVDELGGMDVAIDLAREAAGLEPGAAVRLKEFPRPRSVFELFVQRGGVDQRAALTALTRLLETTQPAVRSLHRLGMAGEDGVLTIPELVTAP